MSSAGVAVALSDRAPVIRPINYVFDASSQPVVFCTSHGAKLHAVLQIAEAAFEIAESTRPCARAGV
jgi:nitroimidazol reductase NimA-like FMN-containing flavoprotein (pyridoxamine 5'-phosphate oxidase superfamily)